MPMPTATPVTHLSVELLVTDFGTYQTVGLADSPSVTVDVYGPHEAFGRMQPAKVNWAGCGSVTAEFAVAYAAAISLAAELAQKMEA